MVMEGCEKNKTKGRNELVEGREVIRMIALGEEYRLFPLRFTLRRTVHVFDLHVTLEPRLYGSDWYRYTSRPRW